MRGTLDFDPAACDYGPATASVRSLLFDWLAIDWFVTAHELAPSGPAPDAPLPPYRSPGASPPPLHVGLELLREHLSMAHELLPDVFARRVEVRQELGGWREFARLCARVRHPRGTWDWKFAALKRISRAHSERHGWDLDQQAPAAIPIEQAPTRPGLFVRIGEGVIWSGLPRVAVSSTPSPDEAGWYVGYAHFDFCQCIEWQLAERHDSFDGNPFLPLTRCYAAGTYPFALAPDSFIAFSFVRG